MKKILLGLLISITVFTSINASHMIGGEITYVCLGGDQYEVTLTQYQDCSSGFFPSTYTLFYESSCTGTSSKDLTVVDLSPGLPNFNGTYDTTSICSNYVSTCNGGTYPGVSIFKFVAVVTLQPCSDWELYIYNTARNPAYAFVGLTVQLNYTPGTFAFLATLNNANGCNTSPAFFSSPETFICQDLETFMNYGATDPDGDSLAFELVNPLLSYPPATSVAYNSIYNANYPITTASGNNFSIDPETGEMYVKPALTPGIFEQSVMAVKVSEYRNGILIGSLNRDVQIITVQGCDPLNAQSFGVVEVGSETIINGDTIRVHAGDTLDFSVLVVDPVNESNFILRTTLSQELKNLEFTFDSTTAAWIIKGRVYLETTIDDVGFYPFIIEAKNTGCPVVITKLYSFYLDIIPNPNSNSINSLLLSKGFEIYPNPVKDKLTIKLPIDLNKAQISILDITGKQYVSKNINSNTSTIHLDLPKGIYFVKIESDTESVVKKLIVE